MKAQLAIEIQEPSAAMVWERLLSFEQGLGDEKQRSELVERIVAFEHAMEISKSRIGRRGAGASAAAQGRKQSPHRYISDMYFGSEIIEDILKRLGILHYFDHVYVSAEVNLTKQTGDLFRRVLKDLDISPHQMRHVGDNHHSDIAMAAEVGVPCVFCEQEHLLQLERPAYGKRKRSK